MRLAQNLGAIQRAAGAGTEVLAVIKADAYGHGAALCAPVLARAGARWFGVTDAAEGAEVRRALSRAGVDGEIVVMSGSLAAETGLLNEHRLAPVVWTAAQVGGLCGLQRKWIQIEVDTGMSRQGVRPGAELDGLLAAMEDAGLMPDGIFTHLCGSEVADSAVTGDQYSRFAAAVAQVRSRGMEPRWVHVANSSGVDNPARDAAWLRDLASSVGARPMVRTGLALYGYALPIERAAESVANAAPVPRLRPALQPVLAWKARILAVRDLAPGDTVGYGATFTARVPMRVALLPVGYAEGLRRELSNPGPKNGSGGWVVAHTADGASHRCPVVGRISMNLTVIDITGVPALLHGDVVTLLGDSPTADDHARLAGTIPYEILCGLRAGERVLAELLP